MSRGCDCGFSLWLLSFPIKQIRSLAINQQCENASSSCYALPVHADLASRVFSSQPKAMCLCKGYLCAKGILAYILNTDMPACTCAKPEYARSCRNPHVKSMCDGLWRDLAHGGSTRRELLRTHSKTSCGTASAVPRLRLRAYAGHHAVHVLGLFAIGKTGDFRRQGAPDEHV